MEDDQEDDQKFRMKIAKMEETNRDRSKTVDLQNTLRQVKDQMNNRYNKLEETIHSMSYRQNSQNTGCGSRSDSR